MNNTLVLGGIRSGKTALAERLAADSGQAVVYVATASAGDAEMSARIAQHRAERPEAWGLSETPITLSRTIGEQAGLVEPPCLLIDCMSLWLSNLMFAGDEVFRAERAGFLEALQDYPSNIIIVSNEVGLGTIGMEPLTRRFCDELGWLNQALASQCDHVLMSIAGLPLKLK
ncbi:bifunctional adenosylcobinamide kinase/adenosylcobinamide-phosphate guanylyltransferase [Allohahella marinimesophila]|uniref:Bifunctional adenosylcobalamin biosynthesis protein n=1 Tax=Allohahella marinimesophila TaxID=1054972 RepID=A0ABP7NZI2_9GAMM